MQFIYELRECVQLRIETKKISSIENSNELIDKIKNIKVAANYKLVSFDLQNLLPSMPAKETITPVSKLLNKKKIIQ